MFCYKKKQEIVYNLKNFSVGDLLPQIIGLQADFEQLIYGMLV